MPRINDGIVVNKAGTRYYLDGAEVTAARYRTRYPERQQAPTLVRNKRQKSLALAVHPDQVGEAAEADRKLGVPTEYTPDGRPIFESRDHRKRFMQAHGYFDRDAGYGDAAPKHHKGDRAPPSRLRQLAQRLRERIRVRENSAR